MHLESHHQLRITHKSWAKRISLTIFLIVIVLLSSALIILNSVLDGVTTIYTLEPENSPYPLKTLNETRLHLLVEGDPDSHNLLCLEYRQAAFHMPFGMLGESAFRYNHNPENQIANLSTWTPEISVNWSAGLSNTSVVTISGMSDSPIHTGEYLQGEALRWAVYYRENNIIGLNAATQQISRVLDGFWFITHVTGVAGRLVRVAVPNNSIGISNTPSPEDYYDYYYGNPCPARLIPTKWGIFASPAVNFSVFKNGKM